jgi:hypothetical protein
MSDWSWKQALADCILEIVNRKGSAEFSLDDVYEYTGHLTNLFPRNTRVRQKIRQVLQRLRDDEGFLVFSGHGYYSLDMTYEEIESDEPVLAERGSLSPLVKPSLRNVRLRDSFLAHEVKSRYGSVCQVCRKAIVLSADKFYSEAHHLKPLGSPHFGPDVVGNIVVLCPNHHILFDRAVVTVSPDDFRVRHRVGGILPRNTCLHVQPWHVLDRDCLEYHHQRFLAGRCA